MEELRKEIKVLREELNELRKALRKGETANEKIGKHDWGGCDGFLRRQEAKKETVDWPFAPVARFTMTMGDLDQISLRGSVWTAVLLAPLTLPLEVKKVKKDSRIVDPDTGEVTHPGTFNTYKGLQWEHKVYNGKNGIVYYRVPTFVALAITVAVQVVFATHMHSMVPELKEDDFGGDPTCDSKADYFLRYVAVCVFLSYGVSLAIENKLAASLSPSSIHAWLHGWLCSGRCSIDCCCLASCCSLLHRMLALLFWNVRHAHTTLPFFDHTAAPHGII